jgi:hypothetical protein
MGAADLKPKQSNGKIKGFSANATSETTIHPAGAGLPAKVFSMTRFNRITVASLSPSLASQLLQGGRESIPNQARLQAAVLLILMQRPGRPSAGRRADHLIRGKSPC